MSMLHLLLVQHAGLLHAFHTLCHLDIRDGFTDKERAFIERRLEAMKVEHDRLTKLHVLMRTQYNKTWRDMK